MIRNLLSLSLLFTLATYTVSANPPARSSADQVVLNAWLQVADGITHDVIVEVEVNGVKDWGRPDMDGRVEFVLPANEVAMLHFRKAGHLTKTVKVDTRNMQDGPYKGKRRSINFEVVMERTSDQPGMAYAGPVGTITFEAGDGEMTVETDTRLVPAVRQQSIVF